MTGWGVFGSNSVEWAPSSLSTFRANSAHTTKRFFVGEGQAGLAIMALGVRVTYTQVFQTPSFDRQRSGLFNFGSLALSARF